jgi:ABC-type polysaccharide/polyol phosphate export permease
MAQSLTDYAKNWFKHTNKAERIWLMAKIEFKLRYYENKMGLLWALMKPVSDMFIYWFAFSFVMNVHLPNFISYVFLGIILWNYFCECTLGTIQILATKRYLYEYTNMDKLEIYLSVMISNFIGFLFNLIIFFIFCLFTHVGFDYNIIFLIPLFLNLIILSLAFSLIVSTIYLKAKDISQIWGILIVLGFWLTPILYQIDQYKARLPHFLYLNPMSGLMVNCRAVLGIAADNIHAPDFRLMGFDLIYAGFFLLIGIAMLKNLGPNASENL